MNYKLFSIILLLFLLITLSIQKRLLKEEDEHEHVEQNNKEKSYDDEIDIENSKKEIDFSKISESQIRKENMPHSQVLLPIRRIGTSNMKIGDGPCGGIEKKSANTLTTKGSSINFIWEVLVPENSGNCTVKISNGLQSNKDFKLLTPVNGEINKDGSFKCGREKGFEYKDFTLPDDYECDGCTLQWKWSTSYGDIYSCSDIIINGGSLSKCMGKCLNGGSCFNGECLCVNGFTGEFCEDDNKSFPKTWLWILLILLCLGGLGFLGYKYYPINGGWTTNKIKEVNQHFPENSSNRQEPEFSKNE